MKINTSNMSSIVSEIFDKCLFKDGEDTSKAVVAEGLTAKFGFHPQRLEENKEMIVAVIDQLPKEFKNGWSFLNLCVDKNDEQWTGEHLQCEKLIVLGIAIDKIVYCAPRALWSTLPGGMPYIQVK